MKTLEKILYNENNDLHSEVKPYAKSLKTLENFLSIENNDLYSEVKATANQLKTKDFLNFPDLH